MCECGACWDGDRCVSVGHVGIAVIDAIGCVCVCVCGECWDGMPDHRLPYDSNEIMYKCYSNI